MEQEQPQYPEPSNPPHRRARRAAALLLAAMTAAGVGGFEVARAAQSSSTPATTTTAATAKPGSATLTAAQIEAEVDPALVDITATLGREGVAEGTGMVITSTGEILTNNHVISGATSITVKIDGTGTAYRATVVGYDATDDIAVLQIPNVSNLATIKTASASSVSVNDAVVALGNALGKGGTPAAAEGVVTAVDQTITASDDTGSAQETLNGLIQMSAAVEPGDSGGATVNASGEVVGMTTAASTTEFRPMSTTAATTAFAIPIDRALAVAKQIESGTAGATVHLGEHGLLGVEVESGAGSFGGTGNGVAVVGVQSGSAAATAGIAAGDTIISINGQAIGSVSDLDNALLTTHVGDKITVAWQDSSGQSHTGAITLTTGAG
jgi:S1-C subfamily serine protease